MAARICSWKSEARVSVGDLGEFVIDVRRLGADARNEVQELAERISKVDVDETDALEISQIIRAQVKAMVLAVRGLEFEWSADDVETPETVDALIAAFDRLDPRTAEQRMAEIWTVCFQEQFMPPFWMRLSASIRDSSNGATSGSQETPGTKRPIAEPADKQDSAKSADATQVQ